MSQAIYIDRLYIMPAMLNAQPSMREPTFYTLAALLDGPLHGYGIIKRAEELSRGRLRLTAGTLYTALDRLKAAGLVEVVRDEVVSGRARRYYRLTGAGLEAVRAEGQRLAEAASVVTERLGPATAAEGTV
jgi:PadR family transcriptional regulator, regulatory protein PadR